MSYTPKYTSEAKVEALLGITIDDTSVPTSSQLLDLIERVEKEMDARLLGSYTSTDELVDTDGGEFVQPNFLPIISVTSLYVNNKNLNETPDWTQLTEGPGDDSSFIVVKKPFAGKLLGIGLYFYDNIPDEGRAKIKITYSYGFNFDSKILEEYATKRVALEVLQVRAAHEDYRVDLSQGPMAALYGELKKRVEQLDSWFKSFEGFMERVKL